MTLRTSLSIALLLAPAACTSSPPPDTPTRSDASANAAATSESPASRVASVRAPIDATTALKLRVVKLAHEQQVRAARVELPQVSETEQCVLYLDPENRPITNEAARRRAETEWNDKVERLARDIDAFRAKIRDDEARAAFDRDVGATFSAVRARIAASATR